jgi:deoxyribodipyrimidine photo-lyase
MHLHWHRRDLRIHDLPPLGRAKEPVLPLFVLDPEILTHADPPRVAFMLDALDALQSNYRAHDSELLLASGSAREIVPEIAGALDAATVSWGIDYSGLARQRDDAVTETLADQSIEPKPVHDAIHHPPGSITTNEGTPYKVFTYFSRKWHDHEKAEPYDTPTGADLVSEETIEALREQLEEGLSATDGDTSEDESAVLEEPPSLAGLGVEAPEATIPPAGYDAARERLDAFCADDIYTYDDARDYPAREGTSRLSPHLKYGTIGIREVYEATETAKRDAASGDEADAVEEFQDQLAWREFYTHVLADRPDVVTQNYKQYEHPIRWRVDDEALQAWKDGETGYPIVDAGMRQLREEAYMHNRVRMIVASFLTKDLLIDWREGYEWFREKLVDHDTANDNGGWQWAASTGTDAQPYFRIFNPMTQGERYDSAAEYITRYVPELDGVPAETIHSWHELSPGTRDMHAPEYPGPIVDHSERREMAIEMFERARDG